jgi:cytochrome c oxidase subunit IV
MYRTYWIAWIVLLGLTLTMVGLAHASLPQLTFVLLMLLTMAAKAVIIAGYFMHLRSERGALVFAVLLGLPAMAAVLFVLIVPDALRIAEMTKP